MEKPDLRHHLEQHCQSPSQFPRSSKPMCEVTLRGENVGKQEWAALPPKKPKPGTRDKQPLQLLNLNSFSSHRGNTCSYFHRSCPTFCSLDPSLVAFNYRLITSVVYVPVSSFPFGGTSVSSSEISDTPHVSSHLFFILTWFIANGFTGLHLSCWRQGGIVQLKF